MPIYLSESKGRRRCFTTHYRDGKRIRKAFPDLAAAKKEALFVAQRIQSDMHHVTDLKPHERDHSVKAVELFSTLDLTLVAAIEDCVQARELGTDDEAAAWEFQPAAARTASGKTATVGPFCQRLEEISCKSCTRSVSFPATGVGSRN